MKQSRLRKLKKRRGASSIAADVRENLKVLVCVSCGFFFNTGMCGRAATESEVLLSAHANGWDIGDIDFPECPKCQNKRS